MCAELFWEGRSLLVAWYAKEKATLSSPGYSLHWNSSYSHFRREIHAKWTSLNIMVISGEKCKPLVKSNGPSCIGGKRITITLLEIACSRNYLILQEILISCIQKENRVAARLFLYTIFLKNFPQGDHSSLIEKYLYFFYLIIVALNKT